MRRLLLIAGGGASFTPPAGAPPETAEMIVIITNTTNYVIADGTPLTFDTVRADDDGSGGSTGAWDPGSHDRLTVPTDMTNAVVEVHLTTLGTGYTGPNNTNVVISVLRNWDGISAYLGSTIAATRWQHNNGASAQLDELAQSVGALDAGDILQVVLASTAGSLLIEANPSTPPAVGSDYRSQPGTGVIGTHFVLRGA